MLIGQAAGVGSARRGVGLGSGRPALISRAKRDEEGAHGWVHGFRGLFAPALRRRRSSPRFDRFGRNIAPEAVSLPHGPSEARRSWEPSR